MQPSSVELLESIAHVFEDVAVQVVDEAGRPTVRFGQGRAADAGEVRCALPSGSVVAVYPKAHGAVANLVSSLLTVVADRERLESDMESMNTNSSRLLEQVSMFLETLPQLSAGGDDVEVAALGARACQRAAEVEQVVYLSCMPLKGCCEVLVHHVEASARGRLPANPLEYVVSSAEGLLADVLADSDGVVLRSVAAPQRLGEPGSPEHLANRQIIGVPVTYGDGDKPVVLGALLLIDKMNTGTRHGDSQQYGELGSEEVQVAESIAAMLGAVFGARKTAAMEKEFDMAQAIQLQILPERPPVVRGFEIAAQYSACLAVGGDYFDYVPLADGRTLVVIADVSGHNLASGMMMVSARAMLRTLAAVHGEATQIFGALAASMFKDLTRTERYLTAAGLALRDNGRIVDYVSAGHADLLVYRAATGRVERLNSEGTILGFVPSPLYTSRSIELSRGDCMLLYTDGVTEAAGIDDELFGDDRLEALFARLAPNRQAQRIVDGIVRALDYFRRGRAVTDDVTAVVIQCTADEGTR
ncbi:MAG TPA: PP2C family protein-serine/threonine phosphatase [Planctomycetota bacterium]|nr:PP2C family protein-serine/threonine phosphatase [Planctomycetota bacterium]